MLFAADKIGRNKNHVDFFLHCVLCVRIHMNKRYRILKLPTSNRNDIVIDITYWCYSNHVKFFRSRSYGCDISVRERVVAQQIEFACLVYVVFALSVLFSHWRHDFWLGFILTMWVKNIMLPILSANILLKKYSTVRCKMWRQARACSQCSYRWCRA